MKQTEMFSSIHTSYKKMAKVVFANEDLKRHIFSFGYPEHIEFTKSLVKHLKVDCRPFQEKFWRISWGRPLRTYLIEEFTEDERFDLIHYFNRCRCCTRHSHYKPYVDAFGAKIVSNSNAHATSDLCGCPCRHLSRHCARTVNHIIIW
jgi:hypothetical protein